MHKKYTLELISETRLGIAKPSVTLIDTNVKLTTRQLDNHMKTTEKHPPTDQTTYQKLVGKLLYLTITILDITFGVQTLSQFLHAPKKSHMKAPLRIVRYVK